MLCQSCGANSTDNKICDYCGVNIVLKDVSGILKPKESNRAKTLGLREELSYIFDDKENSEHIIQRIIEKAEPFIADLELKKAELLSQIALQESETDERAILLSAEVKTLYGQKLAGSISSANIKKKYVSEARDLLDRISSNEFEDKKNELSGNLDKIEGQKASQFTYTTEDSAGNVVTSDVGSSMAGCGTIVGWILGGIIVLGYIISMLDI